MTDAHVEAIHAGRAASALLIRQLLEQAQETGNPGWFWLGCLSSFSGAMTAQLGNENAAEILAELRKAALEIQVDKKCDCHRCLHERDERDETGAFPAAATRMIVCDLCGNKRCPHANDHDNPCTGRNEPGQPGSAYP